MLDPDPDRKPLPQTVALWNTWKNHQAHWDDPTAPDMPMPGEEFRPDEASEPGQPPNVEQEERELMVTVDACDHECRLSIRVHRVRRDAAPEHPPQLMVLWW